MFVNAVKWASLFTYPVIVSKRLEAGKVECGCASFVILNSDGWVLTAAHVLNDLSLFNNQKKEQAEQDSIKASIQADASLNEKQKKRKIGHIPRISNRILNISYWWGADNVLGGEAVVNGFLDLAVTKLTGLPQLPANKYPVFMNAPAGSADFPQGLSVCRLGFPFHEINAAFDEATSRFTLAPGALPVPRFPNDGILTRRVILVDPASNRTAEFIETSTPGLRGQSGGPVFDVHGYIWGIQSRTINLPLGFSPTVKQNSKDVVEHQFLNVGLALHSAEVTKFLQENNIAFNISPVAN